MEEGPNLDDVEELSVEVLFVIGETLLGFVAEEVDGIVTCAGEASLFEVKLTDEEEDDGELVLFTDFERSAILELSLVTYSTDKELVSKEVLINHP